MDKPVRLPLGQVVKVPMGTTSPTLTQMGIGMLSTLESIFGQFKPTVMGTVLVTLMTTARGQPMPTSPTSMETTLGMPVMMTSMATENSTKTTTVTALRPIGIRPMSALTWTKTVVSMLQRMQMMTTMVSTMPTIPARARCSSNNGQAIRPMITTVMVATIPRKIPTMTTTVS